LTKFERKQKRKEIRRAEADERRKEKEKKLSDNKIKKPRPPTYRRDQSGNIILFGNIKVTKLSLVVIGIILAVPAYLYLGANYGDMAPVPIVPFSDCEAIDFNSADCLIEYKFCRTYSDGKTICQYAEEDPFVDVGDNERFFAPEDQDFLPPSQFIVPLVSWADARGADEPSCYTCKEPPKEEDPDRKLTSQELNRLIKDMRLDIQELEIRIRDVELNNQEWPSEEVQLKNDRRRAERTMETAEEDFDYAETKYRHAMDVRVRTNDDILMQDRAFEDYKTAKNRLADAEREYELAVDLYDKRHSQFLEELSLAIELNEELRDMIDELNALRIQANISHRDFQFISIILSNSCMTAIKHGVNQDCPTYRELYDMFDTSIPVISGEMVDLGYDIKRSKSKYNEYWNYYKQMENWKVITVDPDSRMLEQSINIIIQPTYFDYLEVNNVNSKSDSFNNELGERYVWSNIKVSKRCDKILVAPDMELVGKAISHVMNDCESDLENKETIKVIPTPFLKDDSPAWGYFTWLQKAIKNCVGLC